MKTLTVDIKLTFSMGDDTVEVSNPDNKVPDTMVLEALNNLTKFYASKVVADAETFIPENGLEKYLDARLKVDRERLRKSLE